MIDIKERVTMKKACKACGNKVIVTKDKFSNKFEAPKSCATCRTIGVEKAIEQRLMIRLKNPRTKLSIKSRKELYDLINSRRDK